MVFVLAEIGKSKIMRFRRQDWISVSDMVKLKGDRHADSEDINAAIWHSSSQICRPLGFPESQACEILTMVCVFVIMCI